LPTFARKLTNAIKKMLPRLPLVDDPADFWAFSKAGRAASPLSPGKSNRQTFLFEANLLLNDSSFAYLPRPA